MLTPLGLAMVQQGLHRIEALGREAGRAPCWDNSPNLRLGLWRREFGPCKGVVDQQERLWTVKKQVWTKTGGFRPLN